MTCFVNRVGLITNHKGYPYLKLVSARDYELEDFLILFSKDEYFQTHGYDDWMENKAGVFEYIERHHLQIDWLNGPQHNPGENVFPNDWTSEKIFQILTEGATNPSIEWKTSEIENNEKLSAKRLEGTYIKEKTSIKIVLDEKTQVQLAAFPLR